MVIIKYYESVSISKLKTYNILNTKFNPYVCSGWFDYLIYWSRVTVRHYILMLDRPAAEVLNSPMVDLVTRTQ